MPRFTRVVGRGLAIAPAAAEAANPDALQLNSNRWALLQSLAGAWSSSTTMQVQVRPADAKETKYSFFKRIQLHDVASSLSHWATCMFIIAIVCSQLLGALWDSTTTTEHLLYGRSPLLGPSQIIGTNDVPFPDRVIACVRSGNQYSPQLVSSLLADAGVSAILEDSSGDAVHGYRLRQRRVGKVSDALDSEALEIYESSCSLIAKTIDNIYNACRALGYTNLTRDNLRVVDDWDSNNLYRLPNTLPVLIMPYWDNAVYARHAAPTWSGDACIFRLEDAYTMLDTSSTAASFRGVNQSVRHERTVEWLQRPGGVWKNGWYEDPQGMRWYSDVKSSWIGPPYYMMHRLFDMRSGKEIDCTDPSNCEAAPHVSQWGDKFSSSDQGHKINSVYIANASEYGFFIYESFELHTVKSVFDWETLVSNLSVGLVLIRWVMGLVALHSGAIRGNTQWFSGGIGCVSGARSFAILPLASLPRLKTTLAAFWTVGCRFEGQQVGLAEAWFAIYPAIATFTLIYFSLLNLLAKALRRRMSDRLFTPTVAALCLLHYFRLEIAASGWLKGIDGRIPTVVFSDEVKKLQLLDYFTTDIAWQMNGRVPLIFGVKLAILGVNLLPLLVAHSFPVRDRCAVLGLHGIEKALAIRAKHVGGLGRSLTYVIAVVDRKERRVSSMSFTGRLVATHSHRSSNRDDVNTLDGDVVATPVTPLFSQTEQSPCTVSVNNPHTSHEVVFVNSYELVRLGYLVFGDKYLITFDEWDLLSSMALFKSFVHLWNHRVLVWTLRPAADEGDAEIAGGRALECVEPEIMRLDDRRFKHIRWWQVFACSLQC